MEKFKVTKELLECLDNATENFSKKFIMEHHFRGKEENGWISEVYSPLNQLSVNEMYHALYIGYELKETKEDFLARIYKSHEKENTTHGEDFCNGIRFALNALEIKIEGIN